MELSPMVKSLIPTEENIHLEAIILSFVIKGSSGDRPLANLKRSGKNRSIRSAE